MKNNYFKFFVLYFFICLKKVFAKFQKNTIAVSFSIVVKINNFYEHCKIVAPFQ